MITNVNDFKNKTKQDQHWDNKCLRIKFGKKEEKTVEEEKMTQHTRLLNRKYNKT